MTIRTFRENHKTLEELDLSELDAIAQMEHENVVRIFDMVWNINSGGVELYLVYNFCNRGDLAVFIRESGQLPEQRVQSFVRQMSRGMRALRERGIVHRDLKPSNILVEEKEGEVDSVTYKIADLGGIIAEILYARGKPSSLFRYLMI